MVEDTGKASLKIIWNREHGSTGLKFVVGMERREHIWK